MSQYNGPFANTVPTPNTPAPSSEEIMAMTAARWHTFVIYIEHLRIAQTTANHNTLIRQYVMNLSRDPNTHQLLVITKTSFPNGKPLSLRTSPSS
jgi:isocitrate lyase